MIFFCHFWKLAIIFLNSVIFIISNLISSHLNPHFLSYFEQEYYVGVILMV